MGSWYIRDRGRVIGPMTTAEVLDLRDRGQLHGYHEVSVDRQLWRSVDLVPELSGVAPPPPRPALPAPPATRTGGVPLFALIVGGVVAVLVVGTLAVGVLLLRGRGAAAGGGGVDAGAAESGAGGATKGVIRLSGRAPTDQQSSINGAVCLVATGLHVQYRADGRSQEALSCIIESSGIRFASARDFLLPNQISFPPRVKGVVDFGTGSGFIVSPVGHIITNKHVVENIHNFGGSAKLRDLQQASGTELQPRVWVFFGRGRKFTATIVHVSGDFDLAVLKIDHPVGEWFSLCRTPAEDIPVTLSDLLAVGFPGVDRDVDGPKEQLEAELRQHVTRGPVELLIPDRGFLPTYSRGGVVQQARLKAASPNERPSMVLQHGAKVAAGNSGGPVVTSDGLVLGINTWRVPTKVEGNQYFALTLPQLRAEIDAATKGGAVWRDLPK